MSQLQLIDTNVLLEPRKELTLGYTKGKVEPFYGYELPKKLKKPLRTKLGGFSGYQSQRRSALVQADGKWFKYKGVRPTILNYYGEPWGGMSKKKCANELENNAFLAEIYKDYGLIPPLIPTADVTFDVIYEGDNVHAAIQECNGDTRLSKIEDKINELIQKGSGRNPKFLRKISSDIFSWAGFSSRILKEAKLMPLETSLDNMNWTIYNTGTGFGLGRIDHSSSNVVKDVQEINMASRKLEKSLNTISFGTILSETFQNMCKGRIIPEYEMQIEWVDSKEKEKVDIQNKIVYVNKEKEKFCESMADKFYEFFENGNVPRPIEKKDMIELFSA